MAWDVLDVPEGPMESWLPEARAAVRSLWRFRSLNGATVACLALGIGACLTLFASVNPWLFRPLPYPDSGRLVGLRESAPGRGEWSRSSLIAAPDYVDWQARSHCFQAMGAFTRAEFNLSTQGEPERVLAARITADLLPTLGIRPAQGRAFSPDEDRTSARVALIGHDLWLRRFAAGHVLGRTLDLDGTPHVIVGVMPAGFAFPEYAEVWTSLGLTPGEGDRDRHELDAVARLRPDASLARAQAELGAIAVGLEREHPDTNHGRGVLVRPLLDTLTPPGVVLGLYLLLGAGLFVLLIACANVANLTLVKAASRRRDTAVRLAPGAGRGRLLRQRLLESVLLSAAGAGLGLLLASAGIQRLLCSTPVRPPFWVRFDFDWRVAAFSVSITAISALLFGVLPALWSGDASLVDGLKAGTRPLANAAHGRLGGWLVVSELSLSLMLLIGAALMVQSFVRRNLADPGIDTRGVLTARLALSGAAYAEASQRARFVEELQRRLRSSGATQAGIATGLPFDDPVGGHWTARRFEIEGRPVEAADAPRAAYYAATAGHFAAAGIPLRRGRSFTAEEDAQGSHVVIVSDGLAAHAWGRADPLGRRLRIEGGPWLRVVGVVHEVVDAGDMLLLEGKPPGQIYVPFRADPSARLSVVVRVAGDPAGFSGSLREAVRSLDPGLPVYSLFTLDEVRLRSA
jgi:putative ABC transport system permease protein